MYGIQQAELFSFEELMGMADEAKYSAILEHVPMGIILHAVSKKSTRGRSESLNTRAMMYSLIIGKLEHIRYTKDLIKRLRTSSEFRRLCRFTDSDRVPSEAAYSRLVARLAQSGVLRHVLDTVVDQAIAAGFLSGEVLAIDSSHIEAFDRNSKLDEGKTTTSSSPLVDEDPALFSADTCTPSQEAKPEKPKRSKRGRIPKAEWDEWRKQMDAYEASLGFFERGVADMLPASYEELARDMPQYPSTGAKGDPRGTHRVKFWYGYKANLLVDTASQYIVAGETCSAHVSDQRPAIMLLKRLQERFPDLQVKHVLADKGYDGEAVYRQIRKLGAFPIIPLIHRTKLPLKEDKYYRPLCEQGHPYRYDSYDPKGGNVKFTRPKECKECPLQAKGCQKVYKIRIETDVRKYTAPGRGSEKFAELFKQRTAIERVFAYLKLYFGMGTTRRLKKRAFVDLELSYLAYNVSKYALDYLNMNIRLTKQAA
ncbi:MULTISPECIES: transposase [Paenibacillus]|uniref:transposase n=1 Tax=Paenibacillus TaxID=44249 RepID=UPI0028FD1B2B|nr:transposase [Paenibacillus sp. 3LSP]MDU0332527.1 transposase [Paenibacillus sp. 3LSP]